MAEEYLELLKKIELNFREIYAMYRDMFIQKILKKKYKSSYELFSDIENFLRIDRSAERAEGKKWKEREKLDIIETDKFGYLKGVLKAAQELNKNSKNLSADI